MIDTVTCFISDCHSQHQRLERALDWISESFLNSRIVLFGDILDSRLDNHEKNYPPHSDPKKTFEIVRDLVDNESAILLQSNHQDKLKRFLIHHLENKQYNPVTVKDGLQYTLSQFINHLTVEEKIDIRDWLALLPHHVVIEGYDQVHDSTVSFLCSHAYYNVATNIQNPSKQHKQEALYGLLNRESSRVDWWSTDMVLGYYDKPAVRIAAHYHTLFKGKNQRVIDTGCGSTGGSLCIHVPALNLYKEF